jgi:hypothetical protein
LFARHKRDLSLLDGPKQVNRRDDVPAETSTTGISAYICLGMGGGYASALMNGRFVENQLAETGRVLPIAVGQ